MFSKNIYTAKDRTPYTYFIRWNDLNFNYYGRRTAKGCHPDEFFISYFTSSKLVEEIRAEFGEPDVIKIHKIFSDIESCIAQEEQFLKRVNAAKSEYWLNQTNGDKKFDRTGMVCVVDNFGNIFSTPTDNINYISGSLKFYMGFNNKNKVTVRDRSGYTFSVLKQDSRYISGELKPISFGMVCVKNKQGETFKVSIDNPKYISGELIHINCGKKRTKQHIDSIKKANTGKLSTQKGIPLSQEIKQKISKSLKGKKKNMSILICPFCNKSGKGGNMGRYHFNNCKLKNQ